MPISVMTFFIDAPYIMVIDPNVVLDLIPSSDNGVYSPLLGPFFGRCASHSFHKSNCTYNSRNS